MTSTLIGVFASEMRPRASLAASMSIASSLTGVAGTVSWLLSSSASGISAGVATRAITGAGGAGGVAAEGTAASLRSRKTRPSDFDLRFVSSCALTSISGLIARIRSAAVLASAVRPAVVAASYRICSCWMA